jgi:D-alanyl-lipoteichoic acid acyltransferase DltB (MBOAT superfamily)
MQLAMSTLAAPIPAVQTEALDPRVERAKTDVRRFAMLVIPLALLVFTFRFYNLEQPAFFSLACIVFGGFVISYWLPFRYKQPFLILLSLCGAYILLSPQVASLLIVTGLLLFGIIRSGIEFHWRVLVLAAILCVLTYGRATGHFHLPGDFWPVLGAMFMFRMIIYLYDIKHQAGPASLKDFLSYFFLLPNYYFLLFPVVDFQAFRRGYFQRDIHSVAQQGVWWIFRGTTHLLLYRLIYQLQGRFTPPNVAVTTAVIAKVVACYLLYLRISGQFHIIAGMLCLFGYDIPETNHRYFLAHSINDLWRRMNIYWKDFMVKIVYLPAYFKLRRGGALRAELLSTMLVVIVTYILHAYQFFWLKGNLRLAVNDAFFWLILGSLMMVNVWIEFRNRNRPVRPGWGARLRTALQITATFAFVALLWSMWSADNLTEWLYFLRSGNT